jgi:hypothetical protein
MTLDATYSRSSSQTFKPIFGSCEPPLCRDTNEHLKSHLPVKPIGQEPTPWILTLSLQEKHLTEVQVSSSSYLSEKNSGIQKIFTSEAVLISALLVILSVVLYLHVTLIRKLKSKANSSSERIEKINPLLQTPEPRSIISRFILQANSPTIATISTKDPVNIEISDGCDILPRNLFPGIVDSEKKQIDNWSGDKGFSVLQPRPVSPFPNHLFDSETDEESITSFRRRAIRNRGASFFSSQDNLTKLWGSDDSSTQSISPRVSLRVISKHRQCSNDSLSPSSSSSFSSPRVVPLNRAVSTGRITKRALREASNHQSPDKKSQNNVDDFIMMDSNKKNTPLTGLNIDTSTSSTNKPILSIVVPSPTTSVESPHFGVYQADGVSPDIALNSSFHKDNTPSPLKNIRPPSKIPRYSPRKVAILDKSAEVTQDCRKINEFSSNYFLSNGPPSALSSTKANIQDKFTSWSSPVNASSFPAYLKRHRVFGSRDYLEDQGNSSTVKSSRLYDSVI